ncbi:MAG: rod-binding protein [Acetobacteraceae bacterium]|nr:rod-binding protein [Acetobacteraceae bacterium]
MRVAPTQQDILATAPPALRKAAEDFEAMALGQMLQPMFNTVNSAGSAFGGGEAEEAWKPMLVDAIAKKIAAHGGLGLAGPVLAAMLHAQETANGKMP